MLNLVQFLRAILISFWFNFIFFANMTVLAQDKTKLNPAIIENESTIMNDALNSLKSGDLALSKLKFSKVCSMNKDNYQAYIMLGIVENLQKGYDSAIKDENSAIEILLVQNGDKNLALALNARGHAYKSLNNFPQAIHDFNLASRIDSSYADNYKQLQDIYKLTGDEKNYQKIAELIAKMKK